MNCKKYFALCVAALFALAPLTAKEQKEERSWIAIAQDLYARMLDGVERRDWKYTIHHGRLLARRFTTTPYGDDANYYVGIAYYWMREYAHANLYFSEYLKASSKSKIFSKRRFSTSFDIAVKYESGQRRRMFKKKHLPKLFYASKGERSRDLR